MFSMRKGKNLLSNQITGSILIMVQQNHAMVIGTCTNNLMFGIVVFIMSPENCNGISGL